MYTIPKYTVNRTKKTSVGSSNCRKDIIQAKLET